MSRLRDRFPEGRWIPSGQWHLTLKFLGETQGANVEAVVNAARVVARNTSSFDITLGSIGFFPETPDVLWAAVETGEEPLARLARDLESALDPLGFPRESRSFQPHLTLARFKFSLGSLPADFPRPWTGGFTAKGLDLMESRLGRNGSTYQCVEKMVLGGASETHS